MILIYSQKEQKKNGNLCTDYEGIISLKPQPNPQMFELRISTFEC